MAATIAIPNPSAGSSVGVPALKEQAGAIQQQESMAEGSKTGKTTAAGNEATSASSGHRRGRSAIHPDYLSDKATTALIRRILCAHHIAERGRSNTTAPIEELLPPLTSRNDVDLQLYALIAIIIREYVQNWYTKITPDETFVDEVVQIIAHCMRALEQRLRKVDLESLLLDELPELFDAHVRAYRAASSSAARPPVEASLREIYHSMWPLPALSPVPRPDDPSSIQAQAGNEAAYRQLLVQGVLALLLPTEDLENECLTSLVGQIFSELIIGNLVANKVSEPWLLWELIIILARSVHKHKEPAAASPRTGRSSHESASHGTPRTRHSTTRRPWTSRSSSSLHGIFWSLVQWVFFAVNSMRLIIDTLILSRTLPPRPTHISHGRKTGETTSHYYDNEKSQHPPGSAWTPPPPVPVPIFAFGIWTCIANLLEMHVRMPWLSGALSMVQWGGMKGPGRIAGYNGTIDRLLSYHLRTRFFDPGNLPPLLRSIRAAIFPNNAPGAPGLVAPSSDQELAALRRRCAKAVWAVVPKGVGSLYFGGASFVRPSSGAARPSASPPSASGKQTTSLPGRTATVTASVARSGPQGTADSTDTAEGDPQVATRADHPSPGGDHDHDPAASSERGAAPGERRRPAVEQAAVDAEVQGTDEVVEGEGTPHSCNHATDPDEEQILSEIETGLLDLLSDAYCNKHLMYGVLELVLVRLMPDLAYKGIIELWEERLS